MVLPTDPLFLISSQRFNKQKSVVVCMFFTISVKKEFRFNESPKKQSILTTEFVISHFCEFARNMDGAKRP